MSLTELHFMVIKVYIFLMYLRSKKSLYSVHVSHTCLHSLCYNCICNGEKCDSLCTQVYVLISKLKLCYGVYQTARGAFSLFLFKSCFHSAKSLQYSDERMSHT